MMRTLYYRTPFMPEPYTLLVREEVYQKMADAGWFKPGMNWYEYYTDRVIDSPPASGS